MPTEDWLKQNPKVSAHIPQELYQQLQEFMEQRGITRTAEALKLIMGEYFNDRVDHTIAKSSPLVDHSVDHKLTTIESKIDSLSEQIKGIAKPSKKRYSGPQTDHSVDYSNLKSGPLVDHSSPLTKIEGWLTTGEAFAEAQRRGYTKSKRSFKRELSSEAISENLRSLGLVANWEVRQQANPKDNSVRWLKFES